MFGIGGGEMVFIIIIALMLFGADKIPDIARTIAKIMAQVKNATNDIKSEIAKSAEIDDIKSLTNGFNNEVNEVKNSFNKMVEDSSTQIDQSIVNDLQNEINTTKESLDDLTGPIKRQL